MPKLYLQAAMNHFCSSHTFFKDTVDRWGAFASLTGGYFPIPPHLATFGELEEDAKVATNPAFIRQRRFLAAFRIFNFLDSIGKLRIDPNTNLPFITIEAAEALILNKSSRGKLYKIARGFSEQLFNADLNLPNHLLLNSFTLNKAIYIEFGDDQIFVSRDGHQINCCTAMLMKMDDQGVENIKLLMSFPEQDHLGRYTGSSNWLTLNISAHKDFSESFSECEAVSLKPGETNVSRAIVEYAVKCILYVNSGEPDLLEGRVQPERKSYRHGKLNTLPKVDQNFFGLVYVGYRYAGTFKSTNGPYSVRGHNRWQPYGKNRESYRLIWIEAYVKNLG